MDGGVRVKLIPQGYYARSWQLSLMLTLANIHEELTSEEIRCGEGYVYLKGSEEDACLSLSTTLRTIVDDVNSLVETYNLSAPRPGKNDRQVLQKAGLDLKDEDTYLTVFTRLALMMAEELDDSSKCKIHISDLGEITLFRRGGKSEYILGRKGEYAPLQPLKIEKYEYSKDFMNLADIKGDLRASKIWLAMLTSGWMRTYIGMAGGYLSFSLPPDYMLEPLLCDPTRRRVLEGILGREPLGFKGYYKIPARIRSASNPPEAYRILLAIETVEYTGPSTMAGIPPFRVVRVGFDGKTARLIEDSVIDVTQLLVPIARLKSIEVTSGARILRHVRRLAECATKAYQRTYPRDCETSFGGPGDSISMVKILHQAMTGSLREERAVYMLSRLSPEPFRDQIPPFRRLDIVRALLDALRRA